MANSLRAKISKLRHDGNITEGEYQELIKKLDGHDAKVRAEAFNEIMNEMRKSPFASDKATFVKKYIEEQLKEQKNGTNDKKS